MVNEMFESSDDDITDFNSTEHSEHSLSNGNGKGTLLSYNPIYCPDPRLLSETGIKLRFTQDIKLMIVVTFYNEEAEEIILTVRGICENLKGFQIKMQDEEFWKHVCVVLVADGRNKIHPSSLEALQKAGIYDSNMLELSKPPKAHLFQSLPVFADSDDKLTSFPPLQTVLLIKEHNAGKVSSHWWFFEGLCSQANPSYCMMLDVGTKPLIYTSYHIYRCFERNPQISGISGELFAREVGTWNPIIASQQLEYKLATILDRATESASGFLSVLPGCLSAYRWSNLKGQPLRVYFEQLENPEKEYSVYQSLCNLGDDRVLCLELFCREDTNSTLHYLKDAVAESDVCLKLSELLIQRRRWINSTMAVLFYLIWNYPRILKHPKHTWPRKLGIGFIMAYYLLINIFTFILVGIYVVFIDINMAMFLDTVMGWPTALIVFRVLFYYSILVQILAGLNSVSVKKHQNVYIALMVFYGILFMIVSVLAIYWTVSGSGNRGLANIMFIGLMFNMASYFVLGLMNGHFLTLIVSFPVYWFCMPVFAILIPIYCVTNLHDLSWGTKSADKKSDAEIQRRKEFLAMRNHAFGYWVAANCGIVALGIYTFYKQADLYSGGFFVVFCWITILWVGVRMVAAIVWLIFHAIHKRIEKYQNDCEIAARKNGGGIIPPKPTVFDSIRSFIAVVWQRGTVVAMANVLILSPLFAVFSIFYIAVTTIMVISLFLMSAVTVLLGGSMISLPEELLNYAAMIAISWRELGAVEFTYNSYEGYLAKLLGLDRAKKSGTGHLYIPVAWVPQPKGNWFWLVISQWFTQKSWLYLVYIKPLVAFAAFASGGCAVGLPIVLLFTTWITTNMYFRIILGIATIIPALWFIRLLDRNARLITCWSLAQHSLDLEHVEMV